MSTPFIGQIVMFGGNFAPRGWALCDNQLLPISQYSALFSILGTTYGGDGVTTFALPGLRGRVAVHPGSGAGLSHYSLGQKGGQETVTLTATEIPGHTHTLNINNAQGTTLDGSNGYPAGNGTAIPPVGNWASSANATANTSAIGHAGGGQAHTNIQPYQCVNFIIALEGVYPSRS